MVFLNLGLSQPQEFDRGRGPWPCREAPEVEAVELLDDSRHLRVGVAAQAGPES